MLGLGSEANQSCGRVEEAPRRGQGARHPHRAPTTAGGVKWVGGQRVLALAVAPRGKTGAEGEVGPVAHSRTIQRLLDAAHGSRGGIPGLYDSFSTSSRLGTVLCWVDLRTMH